MPPVSPQSLGLVVYPDPLLMRVAQEVATVGDEVRGVARRMIEIMATEEGIGLAAPQVGLSWRLFVAHVPEDAEEGRLATSDPPRATLVPEVYVNPAIRAFEGAPEPLTEGCLSLPEIRGTVLRPPTVVMTYTDLEGERRERRASGLLARCWQHEMDHLDGVLIINRMMQADRLKNRAAIRRMERGGM